MHAECSLFKELLVRLTLFHTGKITATFKKIMVCLNLNFDIARAVCICSYFPIGNSSLATFAAFQWNIKEFVSETTSNLLKLNSFPCLSTIPLLSV